MAERLVGVDIGSSSIRAVEVEGSGSGKPRITRRREMALPTGAARQGEVVQPEVVARTLRRLWSTGGFRTKRVVLGLGGQRIMARDLTVPRMSLAQIRQALPYQVQDALPVPVGDLLLDFYPVSEGGGDNGRVVSGLLIAALRDSVRSAVDAVQMAGLDPVVVDVVPFALLRALEKQVKTAEVVALIDVGASTTSVVVAVRGVPRFIRVVRAGAAAVTTELAGALAVSEQEAEQMKLTVDPRGEAGDDRENRARELLQEFERSLLRSLRGTLGYYMGSEGARPVERILLTGGGARMEGFAAALQELSGIPVEAGNAFSTLGSTRRSGIRDSDGHPYAVALGLALGSAA